MLPRVRSVQRKQIVDDDPLSHIIDETVLCKTSCRNIAITICYKIAITRLKQMGALTLNTVGLKMSQIFFISYWPRKRFPAGCLVGLSINVHGAQTQHSLLLFILFFSCCTKPWHEKGKKKKKKKNYNHDCPSETLRPCQPRNAPIYTVNEIR